jgi:beta-galactosidase
MHWRELDDTAWPMVRLPHDWSIGLERNPKEPCGSSGGYFPTGRGVYRRTVDAPEAWSGCRILVEFEGVYMNAEVWLNQHFLGRHPYGYTGFVVDLTPHLTLGAGNTLTIAVDNSHQPNSRWYSGSGIYRHVWLLVAGPVHVVHGGIAITTTEVTADTATLHVRTAICNSSGQPQDVTVQCRAVAPDGKAVAQATTGVRLEAGLDREVAQTMQTRGPRLWSPDTPHLYRMETKLMIGADTVDANTTTFGVRSIALDPRRGFLLNGAPLKLRGGCVHHDNGPLGAASHDRAEERKVEIHKASGYNAIRCAHNPPAPAFLDACDRMGLLVIDEAFDCWREGKTAGDYHVAFDAWWQRDLESMIRRDRNHPSVVIWSIGNEVIERDGRSGGAQIARMLADCVRRLDPTRPVTAALCHVDDSQASWEGTNPVFAALDIAGYNYLWEQYEPDHMRHPDRLMAGTESFPMEAFDNWAAVEANPYVIGDFVWTSLDYLGEAGVGRLLQEDSDTDFLGGYPWHQAHCGDLDICGFKRPQSYYRDMLWGAGMPIYLVVHAPASEGKAPRMTKWGWPDVWPSWNWAGREGQPLKVEVYSTCQQVELVLNGRSMGVKPAGCAARYSAVFDVPYEPGVLCAVGCGDGQHPARFELRTAAAPAGIRLEPDRPTIRTGGDLCFIAVQIVDGAGIVHPTAENLVTFRVEGPGALLAVGNANPISMENYAGDRRSAFHGRCLAVVGSTGGSGDIRLRAESAGLRAAETVIRSADETVPYPRAGDQGTSCSKHARYHRSA